MATCAFKSLLFPKLQRQFYKLFRATSTVSLSDDQRLFEEKNYSDIPGPKGLPLIGTLFQTIKEIDKMHEGFVRKHKQFGPIFKEKIGNVEQVFITGVEAVEQLLRQDGRQPERQIIPIWLDYRQRAGQELGLVTASGQQWRRMRSVIGKPMLKVKQVESYTDEFNDVITEFLERLTQKRNEEKLVPNLHEELFNWAIESISRVLYEKRLGCLSEQRDPEIQAFIDGAHAVFQMTKRLLFFPPSVSKVILRKWWDQHKKAWDDIFRIAKISIDEKVHSVLKNGLNGDEELGFMAYLLSKDSISLKEVYANVSELMGAAVDTTSTTSQLLMAELALNQDCQQKLYEEITKCIPPEELPTPEHMKNMHYLKAVVKETLRLYPVASTVLRLVQHDMTILGYHIPAGKSVAVSLYALGRLPELYDQPDAFRPERWLRVGGQARPHPFAWLPFGFGSRMCIGRRVAELEIQLLITRLIRQFRIEPISHDPIQLRTDLILFPSEPVRIKLIEREAGV